MAHSHSALGALFMNLAIIFKQVLASISTLCQSNHPLPLLPILWTQLLLNSWMD